MHNILEQKTNGKEWEDRILDRILKMIVYIPKGAMDASKIIPIDTRKKLDIRKYVETEGYGR
jgi:hypothetical protein